METFTLDFFVYLQIVILKVLDQVWAWTFTVGIGKETSSKAAMI